MGALETYNTTYYIFAAEGFTDGPIDGTVLRVTTLDDWLAGNLTFEPLFIPGIKSPELTLSMDMSDSLTFAMLHTDGLEFRVTFFSLNLAAKNISVNSTAFPNVDSSIVKSHTFLSRFGQYFVNFHFVEIGDFADTFELSQTTGPILSKVDVGRIGSAFTVLSSTCFLHASINETGKDIKFTFSETFLQNNATQYVLNQTEEIRKIVFLDYNPATSSLVIQIDTLGSTITALFDVSPVTCEMAFFISEYQESRNTAPSTAVNTFDISPVSPFVYLRYDSDNDTMIFSSTAQLDNPLEKNVQSVETIYPSVLEGILDRNLCYLVVLLADQEEFSAFIEPRVDLFTCTPNTPQPTSLPPFTSQPVSPTAVPSPPLPLIPPITPPPTTEPPTTNAPVVPRAPIPNPFPNIEPRLDCILELGNTFTLILGWNTMETQTIMVERGENNMMTAGGVSITTQPTSFNGSAPFYPASGQFRFDFSGGSGMWILGRGVINFDSSDPDTRCITDEASVALTINEAFPLDDNTLTGIQNEVSKGMGVDPNITEVTQQPVTNKRQASTTVTVTVASTSTVQPTTVVANFINNATLVSQTTTNIETSVNVMVEDVSTPEPSTVVQGTDRPLPPVATPTPSSFVVLQPAFVTIIMFLILAVL